MSQNPNEPLVVPPPKVYDPALLLLPRHLVRSWALFKKIPVSQVYAVPEVEVEPWEWTDFKLWLSQEMIEYNHSRSAPKVPE